MVNQEELIKRDLAHIWHPCSWMKDFLSDPPLIIKHAKGSYIHTNKGPLIDGISSWWCKSLGHGHPKILEAIQKQLNSFEHVITANTTHPLMAELGELLFDITKKEHVYFASDGSSAVEIALKLALKASMVKGKPWKNQFLALKSAYHGETMATMAITDLGDFTEGHAHSGIKGIFLKNIPYVSGINDPLWDSSASFWTETLKELEAVKENLAAIILEPIVQGAAGMLCYSQDYLKKLSIWAKEHDVYLIADEIMTGIGRTGKWLACEHAGISPDIICLSKGLNSGSIPFSCTMVSDEIFQLFYHDWRKGPSFLHSHTFGGNPLGVAATVATLKIIAEESILPYTQILAKQMRANMEEIASITKKITKIRSIGAMVAADFIGPESSRIGYLFAQEAIKSGALLRALGNTLYWLPPLNTPLETIDKLAEISLTSLRAVYQNIDLL